MYYKCVKSNSNAVRNIQVGMDNTRRMLEVIEMQVNVGGQAAANAIQNSKK